MSLYRVISLDGGGIRGILTARILERLNEAIPGFLSRVHLFAGTSTGGLLAVGLAAGMTPGEVLNLYQTCAECVFQDSLLDNLKDLSNLVGAQFSYEPLKQVLASRFGEKRLADLPKKVLVSAFKLDNHGVSPDGIRAWKMKFFQNYAGPGSDGDQKVVDVAVRTAVAPSYFPVYQGYTDGSMGASSPTMCALAQALDSQTGQQSLENIRLLSLGTGRTPHYLPVEHADWGIAQWAPHLVNIMLEADQGVVDFQCRQILASHYHRIDPPLDKEIDLASVRFIPDLLETANQVDLSPTITWIKRCFLNG